MVSDKADRCCHENEKATRFHRQSLDVWCRRCESKWVIWVRQITQTQHLSKDYGNEQVVVCLRSTRGEIAYGEGDASTQKGWCRHRQRALLMSRSDRSQWELMPGLSVEPREYWASYWIAESTNEVTTPRVGCSKETEGLLMSRSDGIHLIDCLDSVWA